MVLKKPSVVHVSLVMLRGVMFRWRIVLCCHDTRVRSMLTSEIREQCSKSCSEMERRDGLTLLPTPRKNADLRDHAAY